MDDIRKQINDIIEADIQIGINDYIEKEGAGDKGQKLNAKISKSEVDKIIKEYKKLKKKDRSNLGQVKKLGLVDKNGNPL
jgi:L-arabinose isomerase|tara:strand:- start:182 stop:421 length:240 start_codon:yes stop_codon:yes gene_type:complete